MQVNDGINAHWHTYTTPMHMQTTAWLGHQFMGDELHLSAWTVVGASAERD